MFRNAAIWCWICYLPLSIGTTIAAVPHIGHLYTSLIADASYRFELMLGKQLTVFSTGTDEHGTKIQQAAATCNSELGEFCERISCEFNRMSTSYNISFTDFTRTTDEKHRRCVELFWTTLVDRGHITLGSYNGWYCEADEAFLADHQINVVKDGNGKESRVSAESGRPVSWVEEVNYKFDLPKFKEDLKHWLSSENSIKPEKFRRQVLQWITENQLADEQISVSRPKSRVHWAVPVPGDPSQTVYVWLDALVNYLTVMDYPKLKSWPPTVQVIGKDILKFHGIFWPAFLLAAGLEPPNSLLVHSHWTVDGEKMSKSRGNIVCPFAVLDRYGLDGMRYFLLREGTPHSDSNYSDSKLLHVINSELADTFGNLLSRCCAKSINIDQCFPSFVEQDFNEYCCRQTGGKHLIELVDALADGVADHYRDLNFYRGIALVMQTLREANRLFESERPWVLSKSDNHLERLNHLQSLLYLVLETLRICGLVLTPIVPDLAAKLLDKLGVPLAARKWSDAKPTWGKISPHTEVQKLNNEKLMLFKRIVT